MLLMSMFVFVDGDAVVDDIITVDSKSWLLLVIIVVDANYVLFVAFVFVVDAFVRVIVIVDVPFCCFL